MDSGLHVWAIADGNDWIVAKSKTEALEIWATHSGENLADYPELDCEQIPDDIPLSVDVEGNGGVRVTHTAKYWADEVGVGFFASRDY